MGPAGPYNVVDSMKHLPFVAFLLSTGLCVWYDVHARQQIRDLRNEYAQNCVEVQEFGAIDAQVRDFMAKKAVLQRWIDTINDLHTSGHFWAQTSVAALMTVDGTPGIQFARVIDKDTIEVKTPSGVSRIKVKR